MNAHDDDFERFLAGDLAADGDFASFADLDDSSPVQPNAALAHVLREGFGTERAALVDDLGARRRRRTHVVRWGAGVAAATLVFGGVAAAGSLPDSVQTFASKVAGVVGISIPRPSDDGREIRPPDDSDVTETDVPETDVPATDDVELIDPVTPTTVEIDSDVDDDPVTTVEVDSDVDDDSVTTVEVDDEADDDPMTTPEVDEELNDDPASQPEEDAELDDDETVEQPEDSGDDDPVVDQSEDDLGADDPDDA